MDAATEEIRQRADLIEVIGQYVALRPAGPDRWKACCPFHDEKTPSFNVSREKGFFKCFGCLDENEPIWTSDGLKPIREIRAGDCVLDRFGQWQSVLATEHKSGSVLEVSTRAFRGDPLKLTPDHTCLWVKREDATRALPFLYNDRTRGVRIKAGYRKYRVKPVPVSQGRADQMQPGDFLLFPVVPDEDRCAHPLVSHPLVSPEAIRPDVRGKKTSRISALPVNVRTARLFGLYLAEGSVAVRVVWWTFNLAEAQTLAREVIEILRHEFGLAAALHLHPRKNTCSVICSKVDLARQLERWFGKGCAFKSLPSQALMWPRDIQQALLQGYLDGDGSQRGVSVSVSRELSYGLFALCIQAGQAPSLSYHADYTDAGHVVHRPSWRLRRNRAHRLGGFFQEIGGHQYFWSIIDRIEAGHNPHRVVDISVAGSESFVTKMGMVHNCGASGDVFKFVQQIENLSFPEAKRQLGERYGVVMRAPGKEFTPEQQAAYAERDRLVRIMAAATAWFREQFAANAGRAARDYARKRELSQSTLDKFGIGYAPDAWDALRDFLVRKYGYKAEDCALAGLLIEKEVENGASRFYDRYRHRLMFPIWDERGQVIAFGGRALEGGNTGTPEAKYINSPEGPLFKKSRTLYGWHLARAEAGKRESIIVTEGYMDAIALHAGGFSNTIATLGTALTTQHVAMLKRLAPKTVYLCFDGDSAGMRAALRAAPLFDVNGLNVRVVALPKEDDPDTFIAKNGAVGFQHALDNARLLAQYRVEMALDGFDFGNIGERAEAIQAASEVIATVQNATEKEEYISWLAGRWAREEGVTAAERMHMIEAAVRRQVASVGKKESSRPASEPARQPWTLNSNGRWQRPTEPQVPSANRDEEQAGTDHTLVQSASGNLSGAARAERLLLSAMLNSPSWRNRILEQMPASQWTQETHHEIASALRPIPEGEPINPTLLLETISPEAGGLASELMLSDQAQAPTMPEVITDCIRRVEGHWARQREREILDLVKGKLERGEAVSPEERAAYTQVLIDTKRKAPLAAE